MSQFIFAGQKRPHINLYEATKKKASKTIVANQWKLHLKNLPSVSCFQDYRKSSTKVFRLTLWTIFPM